MQGKEVREIAMLSTTRSGHNFIKEVIESWVPGVKITVLERTLPEHIYQYKLNPHTSVVLVIRDFRNFLASSIMSYLTEHGRNSAWRENIELSIKAYKAQIEEVFDRQYVDLNMIIFYDQFCIDQDYRQEICKELGGEYTEERLNYVSSEGNGSSFDNLKYQGKGSQMKTRERHLQILDTEWVDIYQEMFKKYEPLLDLYFMVRVVIPLIPTKATKEMKEIFWGTKKNTEKM